jgi:hypothetical protein
MNGGVILAAMASDGQASSPSIDHFLPIWRNRQCIEPAGSGRPVNVPISDEAPKGGGKIRSSHHG